MCIWVQGTLQDLYIYTYTKNNLWIKYNKFQCMKFDYIKKILNFTNLHKFCILFLKIEIKKVNRCYIIHLVWPSNKPLIFPITFSFKNWCAVFLYISCLCFCYFRKRNPSNPSKKLIAFYLMWWSKNCYSKKFKNKRIYG